MYCKNGNIRNDNYLNKKTIKNFEEEFIKNYSDVIIPPKGIEVDFETIFYLYDGFISNIIEGNDISNFTKNIDTNIFSDNSYKISTILFRDYIFGDDKNEAILFYTSLIIRQMIDNIKIKIDDDIAGKSNFNVSDYSRPKMVMISGRDITYQH